MGYCGLEKWVDSDEAADVANELTATITKVLKKALKQKSNEFNTSGPENVALLIEGFIKPCISSWTNIYNWNIHEDEFLSLLSNTRDALEVKIIKLNENKEDWGKEENRLYHLNNYKRMLKSIKYCISKINKE